MPIGRDESRALAFVGVLLLLSAGVRVARQRGEAEKGIAGLEALPLDSLATASRVEAAADAHRAKPLGADERIDLATAAPDDIDRLPGVGPALAERIAALRDSGAVESLAALDAVPGVGARLLDRIAPHLSWRGRPLAEGYEGPGTEAGGDHRPSDARAPADRAGRSASAAASAPATPIDLNQASAAELERLPGVGPALAARIVAWRDSAGGFGSLEELDRVPGIGPALLKRIAAGIAPLP